MDVTEFLRNSSVFDWLVMFLTIVLILAALILLLTLRRAKPFYIVIGSAVIPLAGGLLSTFLKYQQARRFTEIADAGAEVIERAHAEAWVITYIAAVGSIIIAVLGLIGIVTKRRSAV